MTPPDLHKLHEFLFLYTSTHNPGTSYIGLPAEYMGAHCEAVEYTNHQHIFGEDMGFAPCRLDGRPSPYTIVAKYVPRFSCPKADDGDFWTFTLQWDPDRYGGWRGVITDGGDDVKDISSEHLRGEEDCDRGLTMDELLAWLADGAQFFFRPTTSIQIQQDKRPVDWVDTGSHSWPFQSGGAA